MTAPQLPNFAGLTFTQVPVVTQSYDSGTGLTSTVLNPTLVSDAAAGTSLVAAISDPTGTDRTFNPVAEGNAVAHSDAASKWLPVLVGLSAPTVTDDYWYTVTETEGPSNVGQVTVQLHPAAANAVEQSSPMTFKVSPQATVTIATGTF